MKRILMFVAVLTCLALPSAAFASGSSTCQSYNSQLCQQSSTLSVHSTTASTTATTGASTLPFTGLDVGLLVAGGGILLGVGLVVRKLSGNTH